MAANCTNDELALLQWGQSLVTFDPLNSAATVSDQYTPPQYTVVGWGNYGFAGLTVPPEFGYYEVESTGSSDYLNITNTKKIVSNFTDYYGLNDTYNSARLVAAVFNDNTTVFPIYEFFLQLDKFHLEGFVYIMRYQIQAWMFGGAFANITANDLIFGFETPVT